MFFHTLLHICRDSCLVLIYVQQQRKLYSLNTKGILTISSLLSPPSLTNVKNLTQNVSLKFSVGLLVHTYIHVFLIHVFWSFQFTHTLIMSVTAQDGVTALIRAARLGSTDVVVELVRGGANLDLQNDVC